MGEPVTARSDLTSGRAPFIDKARERGQLFIEQPCGLYSESNRETWRRLFARIEPRWRQYAHPRFREGVEGLALSPDQIPRLEDLNQFLPNLASGSMSFKAKAVAGFVPAFLFFDCLRRREYPTTVTIRDPEALDYLPEPDIFHDVAGVLPMQAESRFGDVLARFGEVARAAARRAGAIQDADERARVVESNLKALSRLFRFTAGLGLMLKPGLKTELCVYGSGLLSSFGDIALAIDSRQVQRYPFQLEWVVNQCFEPDPCPCLLFFIDGFDHLFDEVDRCERWIQMGRLDNVCPGEPDIQDEDLRSFLAVAYG